MDRRTVGATAREAWAANVTEDSTPTCARCSRPMRHETALVCGRCGSELRALLARTAKLAEDVETTVARLDHITRTGSGQQEPGVDDGWWKGADALEAWPLPVNLDAARAYQAAYGELTTWARHCCETRGIFYVGEANLETVCAFLAGQVDWARFRDEADEAFKAIGDACRRIERIVDRGPERLVVGRCPCGTWLYAITGADDVKCDGCGTSYDVQASRADLREQLKDSLMTAAEAARMVAHTGLDVPNYRIRKLLWTWTQRGRLQARGEVNGDPTYRFGDALDLLLEAYAKLSPA